jgi:hypothetical protein
MKIYYFSCTMGYIGGHGIVRAKNKKEALELANKAITEEVVQGGSNGEPIKEDELIEFKPGARAEIIRNGDY